MHKGRVLSLRQFGITDFFKKNSFLLFLLSALIFGVFLGVFLFDDVAFLSDFPKDFIDDFISSRADKGFIGILFSSALEFWAVLFLVFLLGASLFGVVTVPSLVILNGFFYGGITAYLYSEHGLKGVAFNAMVFIPSIIVFIIVLLVSSRESIRFSIRLSSLTLNKTMPFSLSQDFKDYCIKFLIFAFAVIFSSLIDAFVSSGLLKHFTI